MAWALLDDNFPHHPKVQTGGNDVGWMFTCGLCYCRRYHTSGFIPRNAVQNIGFVGNGRKAIETLIAVGLWDRVDGGFQIHDYDVLYPNDAEEKDEKSERSRQKAVAGRLGGLARAANAKQNGKQNPSTEPSRTLAESKPIGSGSGSGSGVLVSEEELSAEQIGAEFQQFVAAFHPSGRRAGPLPFGYFESARRAGVRFDAMVEALQNHLASAKWAEGIVPSVTTWLQDQWWHTRLEPAKAAKRDVFDEFVKAGQ
jgi:hypothetical protein